jgi:hypothetical protein
MSGSGSASKGQLISGIDQGLKTFNSQEKQHFLNIVIEEILKRNQNVEIKLEEYLSRLGWQVIDKKVIPIEILDKSDLEQLDEDCQEDLVKSATRFRDGDLSGALSSACAAVDSLTTKMYKIKGLNDLGKASFQEKCNVSINEIGIYGEIEKELKDIGWEESEIKKFRENFKGAINQAAYVMQTLRANMSDAHGSKPVFKPLVFDSIKWSQIIVRLLSDKYTA